MVASTSQKFPDDQEEDDSILCQDSDYIYTTMNDAPPPFVLSTWHHIYHRKGRKRSILEWRLTQVLGKTENPNCHRSMWKWIY